MAAPYAWGFALPRSRFARACVRSRSPRNSNAIYKSKINLAGVQVLVLVLPGRLLELSEFCWEISTLPWQVCQGIMGASEAVLRDISVESQRKDDPETWCHGDEP